ncbi:unnamed protein product [Umbelopsis sp. WA50703]
MSENHTTINALFCIEIPSDEAQLQASYLIVGHDSSANALYSWRLVKSSDSIEAHYLGKDSMATKGSNIASLTKYAGPRLSAYTHTPLEKRFLLCSYQGSELYLWKLNLSVEEIGTDFIQKDDIWVAQGPLESIGDEIQLVAGLNSNFVAIATKQENGKSHLSIWSEVRNDHLPRFEADININGEVTGLSWCLTSDAQSLLAVTVDRMVQIYTQKRLQSFDTHDQTWTMCDKMEFAEPASDVIWADPGVLVVVSGQCLTCYSKWLTPDDTVPEPLPTVFDVAFKMNGPLPLFHPDVLVHYFLWGKLNLINYVLITLYRFLHATEHSDIQSTKIMPPTILEKILHLQNDVSERKTKVNYEFLFNDTSNDTSSDDTDVDRPLTEREAAYLKDRLNQKSIVFMTEQSRMQLIAQVDALMHVVTRRDSVDENAARYMIFLKNFYFLNSIVDDTKKQDTLSFRDMIWARHSQSQDAIIEFAGTFIERMVWSDARALGIFLWLDKADTLRSQMEKIARNTYLDQEDKDPISSTLLYFALGKKSVVHTLWRSANHHKEQKAMLQFLANDFKEPRWQTAASKNAFALLGKQRYEYAAAFFLLAGKLRDATNVLLKHVKDFQLAIAVCRVYEGDKGPVLCDIISNHVLPLACKTGDRWLASMGFWMLEKTDEAVAATVVPLNNLIEDKDDIRAGSEDSQDPSLLILYQYLKQKTAKSRKKKFQISYDMEYNLLVDSAWTYERLGCPLLSLYILTQYQIAPPSIPESQSTLVGDTALKSMEDASDTLATGAIDMEGWSGNFAGNNQHSKDMKPARAIDLFNDNEQVSSDDIFATKSPGQKSHATDLFADEPAQVGRAEDLFASTNDIFASTSLQTSNSKDIFADYLPVQNEESTAAAESPPLTTPVDLQPVGNILDDQNLDIYKSSLVMRMLQFILHAASILSGDDDLSAALTEDSYFKKYLQNMRSDFLSLASTVKISEADFQTLLITKSVESDAFGLVIRILDEKMVDKANVLKFLSALEGGSNDILWLAFNRQHLTLPGIKYVEKWSRDSLSTYSIWRSLSDKLSIDSTNLKILLASYMSMLVTSLQRRFYEQAWGLLSSLEKLLACARTNEDEIYEVIRKCLSNDIKMMDMEPEDYEYFSDDSFRVFDLHEDEFKPDRQPDDQLGSILLEVASLQLIVHTVESVFGDMDSTFSEDVTTFAVAGILDPLTQSISDLKRIVIARMGDDLSRRSAVKQFKSTREKKFWFSLTSMVPENNLLPFIDFSQNSQIHAFVSKPSNSCEVLYKSTSTIQAFCKNKVGDNLVAVCVGNEIREVDLDSVPHQGGKVMSRTASTSSASVHHFQLDHSDLDTDEELGDRNSINEPSELRKQKKKESHIPSRAATPVSKLLGEDQEREKLVTSSSFDNLQDAFKRSLKLNVKENADPVGYRFPSPFAGEMNQELEAFEQSVTLRRKAFATSAESHPQFPFYLVGCDPTDGKASAIIWQYGHDRPVGSYYGCTAKTSRVHFDRFGQKFGAGDMKGNLCLWRFDTSSQASKPYWTWNCHSKATRDFTFLGSSSLIATVGTSSALARKKDHICLWDTLLPAHQSLICSIPVHEFGAYAIAYCTRSRLIFSGGKNGEITVTDEVERRVVHTFNGHTSRIRSMTVDEQNNVLITGSVEGNMKIWDIQTYRLLNTVEVQTKNRFLTPGFTKIPLKSYGVTQLSVSEDGHILTSGPSGITQFNLNNKETAEILL